MQIGAQLWWLAAACVGVCQGGGCWVRWGFGVCWGFWLNLRNHYVRLNLRNHYVRLPHICTYIYI